MTDFPRLLDSSSNTALRDVLSSGLEDTPGPDALTNVAAQLGVSALLATGVVGAASAATQVAAATGKVGSVALGTGASVGVSASVGGGSLLALGKTLLVSMATAGTLSVGAIAVQEQLTPSPLPSTSAAQPALPQPQALPLEQTPRRTNAELAPAQKVTERPQVATKVPASSAPSPQVRRNQPPSALAREVERIDRAKRALDARQPDVALAELESYQRARRLGVLEREAMLLRMEALAQSNQLEQVRTLAQDYLRRFPDDAHTPRIRSLLREAQTSVGSLPSP